nr:hypothetical protein [Tanacetum cinerariifolium]
DPDLNKKVLVVAEAYTKNLAGFTELLSMMFRLNKEEIQAHLDKEEKLENAAREARLSKPKLIKVVHEVAREDRVDLKALQIS